MKDFKYASLLKRLISPLANAPICRSLEPQCCFVDPQRFVGGLWSRTTPSLPEKIAWWWQCSSTVNFSPPQIFGPNAHPGVEQKLATKS
jgi:hypothetical protein